MIFRETKLKGAFLIEPELREDERGFFARTFCSREFAAHNLNFNFVQCNVSFNKKKGTLRGMHYQVAPHEEAKLVRCTRGALYDVIIDLRQDSSTFKKWMAVELTSDNRHMLYIPEGFAHGFLTLTDNSEVFYQMSQSHVPDAARGVRWNDEAFKIEWLPADNGSKENEFVMSDKDRTYPAFGSHDPAKDVA